MVAVRPHASGYSLKPLLAGGMIFLLLGLLIDFQGMRTWVAPAHTARANDCETITNPEVRISRKQLVELLAIPERDTKERVKGLLSEPYCRLPALQVRSGVAAEREAYRLAFDPDTLLVILYENDEYAGYRFNFEAGNLEN